MTTLDWAYQTWPDETPPPVAHLRAAIEETYAAARVLGLDPVAFYNAQTPFALRADAWCHRVDRLLDHVRPVSR